MPCQRTDEWQSTHEVLSLSGVTEEQYVFQVGFGFV